MATSFIYIFTSIYYCVIFWYWWLCPPIFFLHPFHTFVYTGWTFLHHVKPWISNWLYCCNKVERGLHWEKQYYNQNFTSFALPVFETVAAHWGANENSTDHFWTGWCRLGRHKPGLYSVIDSLSFERCEPLFKFLL